MKTSRFAFSSLLKSRHHSPTPPSDATKPLARPGSTDLVDARLADSSVGTIPFDDSVKIVVRAAQEYFDAASNASDSLLDYSRYAVSAMFLLKY